MNIFDEDKLLFVYNANSGIFAAASDFVKKLATPDKYECQLCMVTYGAVQMKNPWKAYLDALPQQKVFMHKDEFLESYPRSVEPLPAIFIIDSKEKMETLVSAEQINEVSTVQDLMQLMNTALKA